MLPRLSAAVTLVCALSVCVALAAPKPGPPDSFRLQTTFELSRASQRLLGGRFTEIKTAHLPSWFNFDLFKSTYGKRYSSPSEELERHHAYVAACVRVLKARVMYRILASTSDASITRAADQVSRGSQVGRRAARLELASATY